MKLEVPKYLHIYIQVIFSLLFRININYDMVPYGNDYH